MFYRIYNIAKTVRVVLIRLNYEVFGFDVLLMILSVIFLVRLC